jgi:hypothetical protein
MLKNRKIVKRKFRSRGRVSLESVCRVILVEFPICAKNFHAGVDAASSDGHPDDQGFFVGTALVSRLGRYAISIITAAGPKMGVAVRTGTPALTTTTGGTTMTGPSRAGTG